MSIESGIGSIHLSEMKCFLSLNPGLAQSEIDRRSWSSFL